MSREPLNSSWICLPPLCCSFSVPIFSPPKPYGILKMMQIILFSFLVVHAWAQATCAQAPNPSSEPNGIVLFTTQVGPRYEAVCDDHIYVYYTPPSTAPRLEYCESPQTVTALGTLLRLMAPFKEVILLSATTHFESTMATIATQIFPPLIQKAVIVIKPRLSCLRTRTTSGQSSRVFGS